jgi:archaellum biogenesis ATPase FlaH
MTKAIIIGTKSRNLNEILLGGFRGGEVTGIAGSFAVGKSWYLINLFHYFLKHKLDPIFISLDLTIESIWKRLIMIESKMSHWEYIRSFQTGKGRAKWDAASERLSRINPRIQYRKESLSSIPEYLKESIPDKSAAVIFLDGLIYPKTRATNKEYEAELRNLRSVLGNKNVSLVMSIGLGRTFAKGQNIDLAKVEKKVLSNYFDKLIVLQSENELRADSLRKIYCLLIDRTGEKTKKADFPIYIDDRIGVINEKAI